MNQPKKEMLRGEAWMAQFPVTENPNTPVRRPVVIIQNNTGNFHAGKVIVVIMTSHIKATIAGSTFNMNFYVRIIVARLRSIVKQIRYEQLTLIRHVNSIITFFYRKGIALAIYSSHTFYL